MEKIICLWSCPRNVSTALMYSFGSREDTSIFDEPLYGHYLRKSKLEHPGRDEIINSLECDGEKVINDIILKPENKINFHKLMTHFLIDLDLSFLKKVTNILFIRDPKEIINSYHKVIPYPTIDDIGIEKQFKLFNYLKSNDQDVVVLDSKELLIDPEITLKKLCKKINIPFDKKMLKWKQGPKKEDGIWAKYWYQDVHKSNCFKKYKKQEIVLDSINIKLLKEAEKYYKTLALNSIK
jgi:hypothetical protein|tara:strand:- start:37 stop:750 length:714 start_codon:yes stop_codon:yes gene_type:complete